MAELLGTGEPNSTQVVSELLTRIYVLKDPRDGAIRYVGKTVKTINARLGSHISRALLAKRPTYVGKWIRELDAAGVQPVVEMIEIAWDDWAARERYWIEWYRNSGARLTNLTDGGEGALGFTHSDEVKALLSSQRKGKTMSAAACAKMSAAGIGRVPTAATCARLKAALTGRILSPESRAKISSAHMGKVVSAEARALMSKRQTGRRHTAESKELIRAANKGRTFSADSLAKMSISSRACFADPASRVRASEAAKARWADLDATKEARSRAADTTKGQFADPAARAEHSRVMIEFYARKRAASLL